MRMRNNTSIKISAESQWVYETKKEKPWYAKGRTGVSGLFVLAVVDICGFIQGVFTKIPDLSYLPKGQESISKMALAIMIVGFIAAFEGSTLYMAYAFTLKLYHYDKYAIKRINGNSTDEIININSENIHLNSKDVHWSKFVSTSSLGWISFIAFVLGVIANIIFRMGLMEEQSFFVGKHITYDGAITIVMIMLPIITSILNFVIGCFTFDPLLFELDGLAKKIAEIYGELAKLNDDRNTVIDELNRIKLMKESEKELLNSSKAHVASLRPRLRTRIYYEAV